MMRRPPRSTLLPYTTPFRAREVYADVRKKVQAEYDEGGSIGKRYRRQDEIGTPWCVTIDHQSKEDGTVTIRDRDSRSEEHTSELQSRQYLVCRLLLEKKLTA